MRTGQVGFGEARQVGSVRESSGMDRLGRYGMV